MSRMRSRGQAVVETTLVLPFFLVAFYGLIWGLRTTIIAERSQLAVRNGGLTLSRSDPYSSYSLYNLYNNAGPNIVVQSSACTAPTTTSIADSSSITGQSMPAFFQYFATPPVRSCDAANTLAAISATGLTFSGTQQAYVYLRDQASIVSTIPTSTAVASTLGNVTTTAANANFLREADLGNLLHCFPELNTAVAQSLNPALDASSGSSAPNAMSAGAMASYTVPLVPAPSCAPQLQSSPSQPY